MIKIDSEKFNWDLLNEVYGELTDKILKRFLQFKKKNNKELSPKFKQYFGDENSGLKEKILWFLKNAKLREMSKVIEIFAPSEEKLKTINYDIVSTFWNLSSKIRLKNVLGNMKTKLSFDNVQEWLDFQDNFVEFFNENMEKNLSLQLKEKFIKTFREYEEVYKILQCNKDIEEIICYDLLSSEQRHKILIAMNILTCPYCNRQYISPWKQGDDMKSTADIDHFFIKSKYPIVSLCLHNFIPCCHVCNSRFKFDTDFYRKIHIYPYEEAYGQEGKFILDNIDYLYGHIPQFSLHVQESAIQREKIVNSVQTFRINEIYKNHTNYVEELIRQVQVYSCSQIEEFYSNFNGMFNSIDEIKQIAFSNYRDSSRYIEHPLSKLTVDILEDLGVDI